MEKIVWPKPRSFETKEGVRFWEGLNRLWERSSNFSNASRARNCGGKSGEKDISKGTWMGGGFSAKKEKVAKKIVSIARLRGGKARELAFREKKWNSQKSLRKEKRGSKLK